jgi:DNA-binding NarL/FixJ family response regulator
MKILVVDDHVLIRQAMQGVLKKVRRDAALLEASNSADALKIIAEQPDIDFALLDLTLPDRDGFSLFKELRQSYPSLGIVVLSATSEPGKVRAALELGARGYIPKSAQADVILSALRLIISGGVYIPPEILARQGASAAIGTQSNAQQESSSPNLGLTDRQLEVLALMMQGKSNKVICRTLDLAEQTVKNHVSAVLRALNVNSRTEAVIAASNLGWHMPPLVKR